MSQSAFSSFSSIISEYKFESDIHGKDKDLRCAICQELMKDSCLNSLCDCHYCYKCINEYNSEKVCPGTTDECSKNKIIIGTNVHKNEPLNRRIAALIYDCPNDDCKEQCQLSKLEEHLRMCIKQLIECPFCVIGCVFEKSSREIIYEHQHSETLNHNELMIRYLQDVQNEFNQLKNGSIETDNVINLEQLRIELDQMKCRENKMKEENKNLRRLINVRSTTLKIVEMQKENAKLRYKIRKNENYFNDRINGLEKKFDSFIEDTDKKQKFGELMTKMESLNSMVTNLKQDIEKTNTKILYLNEERERRMNQLIQRNKLCPNMDADHVWKIDNTSNIKLNNTYNSDPFYSNQCQWKLSFNIRPNKKDFDVGLHCYIMKGDYDDTIKWPLSLEVTLTIVDVKTLQIKNTSSFKHKFIKPNGTNNRCVGHAAFHKCVSDKELTIVNESIEIVEPIIIKCMIVNLE